MKEEDCEVVRAYTVYELSRQRSVRRETGGVVKWEETGDSSEAGNYNLKVREYSRVMN